MPRKKTFPEEALRRILVAERDSIVRDNGEIASKKDPVWTRLKQQLQDDKVVTENYLWTIVLENRYNVRSALRLDDSSEYPDDEQTENENIEDLGDEGSGDDEKIWTMENVKGGKLRDGASGDLRMHSKQFSFTFSDDEWRRISPEAVVYNNKKRSGKRTYSVLKRRVWTHVINDKFWRATHLPCALRYCGGKASSTDGPHMYIIVRGQCTYCDASFEAVIPTVPEHGEAVVMNCTYRGHFEQVHPPNLRRNLSGTARDACVERQIKQKMFASTIRRLDANDLMDFGDNIPAHLPTNNVMRVAKCTALQKQRIHSDPIVATAHGMHTVPYQGIIRTVQYDPLSVRYHSECQTHAYNKYCQRAHVSTLKIDATGNTVMRITRADGMKSGPIFTYNAVIRDEKTGQIFPVTTLVSESHNTESLRHWLSMWLREGAEIPREVVVDQSLALMSACVQGFTKFASLADYVTWCASLLQLDMMTDSVPASPQDLPHCFVRNDVAHVIKLIKDWPSLKGQHRLTRSFYRRCMGQVIQCTSLPQLKIMLQDILTVALTETEGNDMITGFPTSCELSKQRLLQLIGGLIQPSTLDEDDDEPVQLPPPTPADSGKKNQFSRWVEGIAQEIVTDSQCGDRGNQQYSPDVLKDTLKLAPLIPFWTAVMVPLYGFGECTASSSYVESDFNDMKHRVFKGVKLPIRLDDFVFHHIKVTQGAVKLNEAPNAGCKAETTLPLPGNICRLEQMEIQQAEAGRQSEQFELGQVDQDELLQQQEDNELEEVESKEREFGANNTPGNADEAKNCWESKFNGMQSGREESTESEDRGMWEEDTDIVGINSQEEQQVEREEIPAVAEENETKVKGKRHADEEKDKIGITDKEECREHREKQGEKNAEAKKRRIRTQIKDGKETDTADINIKEEAGQEVKEIGGISGRKMDMEEEENWRNQTKQMKRNRKSTLNPNREWLHVDLRNPRKRLAIGILKNGHRKGLQAVKIGDKHYALSNTCAYDSLVQLLCVSYCDSNAYKEYLDGAEEFGTGKIVRLMMEKGVSAQVYRLRAEVLINIYTIRPLPGSLFHVPCEIAAIALPQQILTGHQCATEFSRCDSDSCPETVREREIYSFSLSLNSVEQVETLLQARFEDRASPCGAKLGKEQYCAGVRSFKTSHSSSHLFVETAERSERREVSFQTCLSDVPIHAEIQGTMFHLRGLVGFFGPQSSGQGALGHYVAYCRRHDGCWEEFNDLKDKSSIVSNRRRITCHMALYTV